jgi:hypothetical protein
LKYKRILSLVVVLFVILLSGCTNKSESQTLYSSDSVRIVRTGNITTVSDLLSDASYTFKVVRKKRSDGVVGDYTHVDTDTIKIEVQPKAVLIVTDKQANKVCVVHRKSLKP